MNDTRLGVSPFKSIDYRATDGLITGVINRPPDLANL